MSVADLYAAAKAGNHDEVMRLISRKVDINGWINGLPGWIVRPIYGACAATFDNSRVINTLIVSGADFNYGAYKQDSKWWVSPLWKAAHAKIRANVSCLLKRGALMINKGDGPLVDLTEVNLFVQTVRMDDAKILDNMKFEEQKKREYEEHQKKLQVLEHEKKIQQQKLMQQQQKATANLLNWLNNIKLPQLYDTLIELGITDVDMLLHLKENHLPSKVKIIEREVLMNAVDAMRRNSPKQNSNSNSNSNDRPANPNMNNFSSSQKEEQNNTSVKFNPFPFDMAESFKIIDIDKYSNEFKQLKLEFSDGLQGVHNDYVGDRIKKGMKPIGFSLVGAKKIINPDLYKQFEDFRNTLEDEHKIITKIGYHGTSKENLEKIALNGLLKIGHPKNPSKSTDPGYFGDPRHGVYIGKYIEYTLKYTQRPLRSATPGDKIEIVRFKLLPGKSIHIPNISMGMLPTPGHHSHLSPNYLEWYIFNESQCYPEYILEVEAFENHRVYSDDGTTH